MGIAHINDDITAIAKVQNTFNITNQNAGVNGLWQRRVRVCPVEVHLFRPPVRIRAQSTSVWFVCSFFMLLRFRAHCLARSSACVGSTMRACVWRNPERCDTSTHPLCAGDSHGEWDYRRTHCVNCSINVNIRVARDIRSY